VFIGRSVASPLLHKQPLHFRWICFLDRHELKNDSATGYILFFQDIFFLE
jgi:hypothetical protein